MRLRRFCFLALAAAFFLTPPVHAQDSLRIIAVVNDGAITALDLATRLRIAIVATRLDDTDEVRKRLAPQVLRALIDEQIRQQEADRQGIKIPSSAIDGRLDELARENQMDRQQFEEMLAKNGIPVDSLKEQIRTEMAWSSVIRRRFQSGIVISPEDIADARNRIIENQGAPEFLVAEIFLAADNTQESGSAEDAARRLLDELKKGANFAAVARQFSQAPTAARGGDLGWVQASDLPAELRSTVEGLQEGQVAGPIEGEGGYYIVLLRGRRENSGGGASGTVDMKQVLLPLEDGATSGQVASATEAAQRLREDIASCADAEGAGASADAETGDLTGVDVAGLPGSIQSIAINQPIGQASQPLRVADGIAIYVVCARNIAKGGPSDEDLREQLVRERLDLMARGYLRDLRRTSFVDIRG
jgi:peptidyl-prolyl cis-trans isomerase SurA